MSVQVRPYLRLLQIAAVATGRVGSRRDPRSQPLNAVFTPLTPQEGPLGDELSLQPLVGGASSSFTFQVCQSGFESRQQTLQQWPPRFHAFSRLFFGVFFCLSGSAGAD